MLRSIDPTSESRSNYAVKREREEFISFFIDNKHKGGAGR